MKFGKFAIGCALSALIAAPAFAGTAGNEQKAGEAQHSAAMKPASHEMKGNAAVKTIQDKLDAKGYKVGKVDGIWGPRSAAALKKFQKASGLKETGELDQKTADTLGVDSSEFAAFETEMRRPAEAKHEQKSSSGGSNGAK